MRTDVRSVPVLLSTRQAARWLGVSESSVRRMVRAGQLRDVGSGRSVKIARAEVERLAGRTIEGDREALLQEVLDLQAQLAAAVAKLVRLQS